MLKTGQTINIEGRWGTVTYLIGNNAAIVTMDDDLQVQAWLESLRLPVKGGRYAYPETPDSRLDC